MLWYFRVELKGVRQPLNSAVNLLYIKVLHSFLRKNAYNGSIGNGKYMTKLERIGLHEAIAALRAELIESVVASHRERLRFEVEEITMEFQLEVERSAEAKGGIKFWVVELSTGGTVKDKDVHKVVTRLKPVRADGKPILTGSVEKPTEE
jgi:hypothetical protein